jgi:inner membrane protein
MPSPIGHALAGLAAGWAVGPRRAEVWQPALFAAAGMAADVDLLFGAHSGPTHGLGAAVIVGIVTIAAASALGWRVHLALHLGVAVMAAYATHTLLDWLGSDSSPPIGIMALWPFSRDYYESSVHLFGAISRRYWLPHFWSHNLRALAWEIAILVPIAAVAWVSRGRTAPDRPSLE